jgi:NAD-dependent deacetylase
MDNPFKEAARIVKESNHLIALTGAGISVESGIPDFRSAGGLWEKYDPAEYATIEAFRANPVKIWDMIFDMTDITRNAKPNPAHEALAKLEKMDRLKYIITQNIDNLHQAAGSSRVIEYHGNASRLECLSCSSSFPVDEFELTGTPPECFQCGAILKPSVIFFGEMIPRDALIDSQALAESSDAVLVIGTSAVVYPASSIPYIAKQRGARIVEMNLEQTGLTLSITDVFIQGRVGETLPKLLECLDEL